LTDEQIADEERTSTTLEEIQTEDGHSNNHQPGTISPPEKMGTNAHDLAELVFVTFRKRTWTLGKSLILKSVAVLKLNPPPGTSRTRHQSMGRS